MLATKFLAYREVGSDKISQLAADCFRVLLSWADADAGNADRPGGAAAAAGRAVQLLDAAAAVAKEGNLPSAKTFHARMAQYCQAVGDATRAQAEQQLAAATVKETPLDHFLTGLDDYRKQQFSAAATESDAVLRDEPRALVHGRTSERFVSSQTRRPLGRSENLAVRLPRSTSGFLLGPVIARGGRGATAGNSRRRG